jgi:hypothetical protein
MIWNYGTCNNLKSRQHKIFRYVQFLHWKNKENGHKKDYWINFDKYWYKQFKKNS